MTLSTRSMAVLLAHGEWIRGCQGLVEELPGGVVSAPAGVTRSGRLRSGPCRRLADAGSIPQMGIELATGSWHIADASRRWELVGLSATRAGFRTFPQEFEAVAELHRFGAGFHPTETPQEFESLRTNPQEPAIARSARW